MSIAVSTVVQPSRQLAVLMGCFCLLMAGIAGMLLFDSAIGLPLAARLALGLPLLLIPVWASRMAIGRGKSLRIDISEHGQIMVAEDKTCTIHAAQAEADAPLRMTDEGATVFRLLPDSTLWPHLLLLRLQAEGPGKKRGTRNVLILRDCMSAENFRALAVACRWIAAHNGQGKR